MRFRHDRFGEMGQSARGHCGRVDPCLSCQHVLVVILAFFYGCCLFTGRCHVPARFR